MYDKSVYIFKLFILLASLLSNNNIFFKNVIY